MDGVINTQTTEVIDQQVDAEPTVNAGGTGDNVEPVKPDPEPQVNPELLKYKKDMLRYKDEANALKAQIESDKKARLAQSQQWEELAKNNEAEAEQWRAKYEGLSKSVQHDKKYSAVKEMALASGLRKEALADLELLDLDNVELEFTSSGRVNVLNADKAVEYIKQTRPHWFGNKKTSVNSNDPGVVSSSGLVTMNDLKKAEDGARKSGDYSEYKKLLLRYRDQLRSQ